MITILLLSPYPQVLQEILRTSEPHFGPYRVRATEAPLTPEYVSDIAPEWVISYGYRSMIRPWVLGLLPHRVINLHISLLPYNRGSDPNFWSWFDQTPKGVTIHEVDEGLDTGAILTKRQVHFDPSNETLASSYTYLRHEIERLFADSWPLLLQDKLIPVPQPQTTMAPHKLADKTPWFDQLSLGWQTPVSEVIQLGKTRKISVPGYIGLTQ